MKTELSDDMIQSDNETEEEEDDKTSFVRLESSDREIFKVWNQTVKEMKTIQTMIDMEGDEENDESIMVPVRAEILRVVIDRIEGHPNAEILLKRFNLKKVFEVIKAADYLDVECLLKTACQKILIENTWEKIEDAAHSYQDTQVLSPLERYRILHGDEVIVTLKNKKTKSFNYFDTKVCF